MFLFILVPIVAFLIGAILSQALMMGKTRTTRRAFLVIGVCCCYLIVAFTMPFWTALAEVIYVIFAIAAVTLIMTGIFEDGKVEMKISGGVGCLYAFSVYVFLPLVLFTSAMRAYQAREIAAGYDGIVTAKYRSWDHAMPSIELAADSGETTTVEGVDLPAWNAIVEKRSHVTKPAWSVFGQVDGKPFRLVPQKRVFGIGPLPD